MKAALLVMTDGRFDCLRRTLASFDEHVLGEFAYRIMIDDSGDALYAERLEQRFGGYQITHNPGRHGFCGALNIGWKTVPLDATHVFHLEDDFLCNVDVPLAEMAAVLDARPYLVQLVLKRQPWSEEEKAWGDLVRGRVDRFEYVESWVEHREYFSTNPNLMRTEWIRDGMMVIPECEGKFGLELLADPSLRFAFWGSPDDPPVVHHIGDARTLGWAP